MEITLEEWVGWQKEFAAERAAKKAQCPTCGHYVKTVFDHVDIDCEHDMTVDEITALQNPSRDTVAHD